MKNRYHIRLLSAAAVIFAATSCSESNYNDPMPGSVPERTTGGYPLTIAANYHGDGEATRALLDPSTNTYYWTPGDRVGLFATDTGSSTLILNNLRMDADAVEPTTHTTFTGTVTQAQIDAMPASGRYDYYSYFPYTATPGGAFPNITFRTESSITVTPNVFNPAIAPMVATAKLDQPSVLHLDGSQGYGGFVCFDYEHVFSYAAIEMDCRLLPEQVTSITITSNSTQLWGTYSYNMSAGAGSGVYSSGGNTLTVNISGGLTVDRNNILYIPMPPTNMTGHTLTFHFNTANPSANYIDKSIQGVDFRERGRIYHLRISPAAEYRYRDGGNVFTTTVAGYYYVEAWGGNGGSGEGGRPGGGSQKVTGLYYFSTGTEVSLYVGQAGADGINRGGTNQPGGKNGSQYGNGGNGGRGGTGGGGPGGDGGSGGAGTLMFIGGTSFPVNLRLVSGGAGGAGGYGHALTSYTPGAGGNGGTANNPGVNGGNAGGNQGGNGGNNNGVGGDGGSDGYPGGNANSNGDGGTGTNGENGSGLGSSGAGSGGGGGGYRSGGTGTATGGGGGGEAGAATSGLSVAGGGGGGAGGSSYVSGTDPNPPTLQLPNRTRPSSISDGRLYITFFRP